MARGGIGATRRAGNARRAPRAASSRASVHRAASVSPDGRRATVHWVSTGTTLLSFLLVFIKNAMAWFAK